MKLDLLFTIVSYPLLIAALPEGSAYREFRHLTQQCANFELSCCSNFRSSAEGTQLFETSGSGVNVIGNAVAVLGQSVTGPLQQLIPTSILSGCAPIIGDARIECTNYIACCVPEGRGKHGLEDDENTCKILKDTRVNKNEGLIPL